MEAQVEAFIRHGMLTNLSSFDSPSDSILKSRLLGSLLRGYFVWEKVNLPAFSALLPCIFPGDIKDMEVVSRGALANAIENELLAIIKVPPNMNNTMFLILIAKWETAVVEDISVHLEEKKGFMPRNALIEG
jgi:hypothetical protein